MSKTKKILSMLVAVAMLLSVVAVSAFAYTPTDTNNQDGSAYTQSWDLSEPVKNADGTYTVNVTLKTNYKVGTVQFKVANTNNTGVKLTSVTKGAAYTNAANIQFSNESGTVVIVPKTAGKSELKGVDLTAGGVVAVLTYTVSTGASADINIVNAPKGTEGTDVGGSLIATRCEDVILESGGVVGQTVLSVGNTRHIGTTATPKLAVIDGKGGVIDENRGYIYGIDVVEGEAVEDVFEVTDGGSFEITANGNGGEDTGTGSLLTVLDASGEPTGEEYYIVIFGDINGDGWMDSEDAGYIVEYGLSLIDDFTAIGDLGDDFYTFAGDVTGDAYADSEDAGYIVEYGLSIIDALPYSAAELAAMNYEN